MKQERYLSSDPFSSRPASKSYMENWERMFGKKQAKDEVTHEEDPADPEAFHESNTECSRDT